MGVPALSEPEARTYLAAGAFRAGRPGPVGVELEYVLDDPARPGERIGLDRIALVLAALPAVLPGGGLVTVEPGGQLELSSAPAASLTDCVAAVRGDLGLLRGAVAAAGLRLRGTGLDGARVPERVLPVPRYAALERYYDRRGPQGRAVMCNSASIQVCLDAGVEDRDDAAGYRYRWWLADGLGPTLLACFANSPAWAGRRSGWRSTRQVLRFGTDPSRCRAPRLGADPRALWARYALDANVVGVRPADDPAGEWLVPEHLTFRDWLRGSGPRPATLEDLETHIGTLFPPVRPRGYLEFRMLDQQPGEDGWIVPLALIGALFDDPVAAATAASVVPRRSVRRHRDWLRAARYGMADPELSAAATACFDIALAALDRAGVDPAIRYAVADYADRYPRQGRCPADDEHRGRRFPRRMTAAPGGMMG